MSLHKQRKNAQLDAVDELNIKAWVHRQKIKSQCTSWCSGGSKYTIINLQTQHKVTMRFLM